ncbi:hypothetical protein Tco_1424063 [Tanacetum coccineum]
MALTRRDILGVVIPELGNDVDFEIKSQFMSKLRCKLFAGTDDEDTHEHMQRVLKITDLFHIPGVTRDAVMLRVFPMTLIGAARRCLNMLHAGSISTWDLLEEAFIRKYWHLKEQEDEAQAFSTLESLKKLKINRSLICAVKIMPEYLLYVKDMFSSKKPIVEKDVVRLNDRCTVVLQSQPPPKENDPGSFNLPCLISNSKIRSALADLGASINVMPFSMFKKLQIGNLQPTNMMVEMADMTKKAPKGIIENVLVQIDKFIFLVDFVIIDI